MNTRSRHAGVLAAAVATLVAIVLAMPSAAAPPSTSPVQAQINAHLAAYPGGTQVSATEISYADGKFVMTFVTAGKSILAADCPSGWFCFYDQVNYGYPRGKLSSCGWQDLSWWGWQDRTESVHYNMSTGSVAYINHWTAPDHSLDYTLFSVSPSAPTDNDVAPYRNMADHVYRSC
jgi:hypothetical protein